MCFREHVSGKLCAGSGLEQSLASSMDCSFLKDVATRYQVQICTDGINFRDQKTETKLSSLAESLDPNTNYWFRVQAVNGGGDSEWSTANDVKTSDATPTGLIYGKAVDLNWPDRSGDETSFEVQVLGPDGNCRIGKIFGPHAVLLTWLA